jgi:CPA1 family monovalent cation:H+ antiporter
MELTVQNGAFLLLIAVVVAMLTQKLNLPYSAGLVAAGIVLAFSRFSPAVSLTKDLLFTVLLPPLIFQAAFYIEWRRLRRDLGVIVVLATLGVILSAGITTIGMHYLASWPWISALVFGVLIAATDPVSVIATFQEAGARGRLPLLVEAESLFNDGTAAVGFAMVLDLVQGHSPTPLQATWQLLRMAGGGLLCGAAIAAAALLLVGNTQDHLVELALTTVAAYGSFLIAERFHMSGVLATLAAGLTLGNIGSRGRISDRGKEAVQDFWEYAAFVTNSLIFLLIGMRVAMQDFRSAWIPAAIDRYFAGHAGTRGCRLSMLRAICGIGAESAGAVSASSILGWFARRAGLGARFSASRGIGSAGCDRRRQLRGCGLLDLCPGPDDETAIARRWTSCPRRLRRRTRTPSVQSFSLGGAAENAFSKA